MLKVAFGGWDDEQRRWRPLQTVGRKDDDVDMKVENGGDWLNSRSQVGAIFGCCREGHVSQSYSRFEVQMIKLMYLF